MRALTVRPGVAGSARVERVSPADGPVLVRGLENDVVFGAVSANRLHYESGVAPLARADRDWPSRLVSRRVPLDRWPEAFERTPDDVKVVIDLDAA